MALPQGELTSEQIEDVMTSLSEMGVNVVDEVEGEEPSQREENDNERRGGSRRGA